MAKKLYTLYSHYYYLDSNLIFDYLLQALNEKITPQQLKMLHHKDVSEITFQDLQTLGFKDLYVMATRIYEVSGHAAVEEKIFSSETTPHTSVVLATYASTAAPFFFPKPRLKEISPGRFIPHAQGDIYDDGGLMNNYLIELFDKLKYMPDVSRSQCQNDITNPHTLGLNLDVIGHYKPGEESHEAILPDHKPLKYFKALVKTGMTFDKKNLNPHNADRTILIDRHHQKFFAFGINDEMKQTLQQSGHEAVSNYFDHHNSRNGADNADIPMKKFNFS